MATMSYTSKFSPADTVYLVDSTLTATAFLVTSLTIELRPATGNSDPVIMYGLKNSNKRVLESSLYTLDEAKIFIAQEIVKKEVEIANL